MIIHKFISSVIVASVVALVTWFGMNADGAPIWAADGFAGLAFLIVLFSYA